MLNRRSFLLGAAGAFSASFAGAGTAQAEDAHPLSRLVNINTGENFSPQTGKYSFVIFMTAQKIYADCGGAFIGVHQIMQELKAERTIEPVLVMPKISDQEAGKSDLRNLDTARTADYPFTIVTGELSTIMQVADQMNKAFPKSDGNKGPDSAQNPAAAQAFAKALSDSEASSLRPLSHAVFNTDAQGKVNAHTLDGFFMTESGKPLIRHRADDYIMLITPMQQIMSKCSGVLSFALCR